MYSRLKRLRGIKIRKVRPYFKAKFESTQTSPKGFKYVDENQLFEFDINFTIPKHRVGQAKRAYKRGKKFYKKHSFPIEFIGSGVSALGGAAYGGGIALKRYERKQAMKKKRRKTRKRNEAKV